MEEVKIIGLGTNEWKVELSGDIDLSNAEAFYQEVMTAYAGNPKDVLFDCENLNFIDSTTLGTFVKILKNAKADGYTLRLTNLQAKIKKLFLICALDKIMEID